MITSAKKTFFLFSLALMPLLALDATKRTLHRSPCITPEEKQPRRRSQLIAALRNASYAQPVVVAEASDKPLEVGLAPENDHNTHLSAMEKLVDLDDLQMVIDNKYHENFLVGLSTILENIETADHKHAGATRAGTAATFDANKAVYALVQQRAHCVNAVLNDDTGVTSLMRASASLAPAIVQALLDAGADPLARDNAGLTAIDYARKHTEAFPKGRKNIIAIINKALKARGARSFQCGDDGEALDEEDPAEESMAPSHRDLVVAAPAAQQQVKRSLLRQLCCCCCSRRK